MAVAMELQWLPLNLSYLLSLGSSFGRSGRTIARSEPRAHRGEARSEAIDLSRHSISLRMFSIPSGHGGEFQNLMVLEGFAGAGQVVLKHPPP
jgi:hypothetical protein